MAETVAKKILVKKEKNTKDRYMITNELQTF